MVRLIYFLASCAIVGLAGCSGMVAPTNPNTSSDILSDNVDATTNPNSGDANQNNGGASTATDGGTDGDLTDGDLTDGDLTDGDLTDGGSDGGGDGDLADSSGDGDDDGGADTSEIDPVGSAENVAGDFNDLDLRYMYATHRGPYSPVAGFEATGSLRLVFSEAPYSTKKVKEYKCLECNDDIKRCFCAKDENKDNEKCEAEEVETPEYDDFSITFTTSTATGSEDKQVTNEGWPKKSNYELVELPTDFADPTYAEKSTANGLEAMIIGYAKISATPIQRNSVIGSVAFVGDKPESADDDFEVDVDITFKKNELFGDTADDQKFSGKFSGPIFEYEEPIPYPTDCSLPDNYVETVYE